MSDAPLPHDAFVRGYREGGIRVDVDRKAAARFVSARLLLPLVMLPLLGIGTALALSGWIWTGLSIVAVATLVPLAIKRGAPHFVISQALEDEKFYADACAAGAMRTRAASDQP